jgi:hypothetical protein
MIGSRRVVTFKVTNDGKVAPAWYRRANGEGCIITGPIPFISAHESFRRWKVARKAWKTRKYRNQLSLPL